MEINDKTKRINKEKQRLLKVFSNIDANKLQTVMSLIDRASFITVSLEDIEQELMVKGWTEEYQNGANQNGKKKSASAEVHISLTKNLNAIIKQLVDLCPAESKADSKLMAMMRG